MTTTAPFSPGSSKKSSGVDEAAAAAEADRLRAEAADVEKPLACVFCLHPKVWWNGYRTRAAAVLLLGLVRHMTGICCRRVRCAKCGKSWTQRPGWLKSQRHSQPPVVAKAIAMLSVQQEEATKPDVPQESEAARSNVSQESEAAKPDVSQESEAAKPSVSQESEAAKPDVSQESEAAKPDVSQESEAAKPDVSQESEAAKPNVSQEEAAKAVGCSRRTVWQWLQWLKVCPVVWSLNLEQAKAAKAPVRRPERAEVMHHLIVLAPDYKFEQPACPPTPTARSKQRSCRGDPCLPVVGG